MPSLKEIKSRIASVNSTRKITSAMKMVASSKLHHAQVMIENMLPYENTLEHILKSFLAATPDIQTPYNVEHEGVKRVALVVYASNGSLCGGFNANIIRLMQQAVSEHQGKGREVVVYPIGRKVAEKAAKMGLHCAGNYIQLADKPQAAACRQIAEELCRQYSDGQIDRVELIYHHFKSAGSQTLQRRVFLPIDVTMDFEWDNDRDLSSAVATKESQEYIRNNSRQSTIDEESEKATPYNDNFIVEPSVQDLLHSLIPKELNLMLYTALLDSNASEHAARMVAMQAATDNADELLRALNLQYNKSRQQAITSELLDIVGGSAGN